MKKIKAKEIVGKILTDNSENAQTFVKSTLDTYKYRMPEVLAQEVFNQTSDYAKYASDIVKFDTIIRLVNVAVWTKTADKYKQFIRGLVFVGLQNKSGKVRQNARALSQNYTKFLNNADEAEKYLNEIEDLIKIHEPKRLPMYVDTAAPSVYKSLVLMWHDTMYTHQLWEKLNYLDRIVELDIPCYSHQGKVEDDDEEDTPDEFYFTREEWKKYFEDYVDCNDWDYIEKTLKAREEHAASLLDLALKASNIDKIYHDQIIEVARSSNPKRLENILMNIAMDISERYEEARSQLIVRTDSIARAIQTMDNNAVVYTSKGNAFSRVLTPSAVEESWHTRPRLVELKLLVEAFAECHKHIDDIIGKVFIPSSNKLSPTEKPDLIGPTQIAHYIVDWLIQIKYQSIIKNSPNKIAAAAWMIVQQRNPLLHISGLDNTGLNAYGEWPSLGGLGGMCRSLSLLLDAEMADPIILGTLFASQVDMYGV